MRLIRSRPAASRCALLTACACAFGGVLSASPQAGQPRSLSEGVYSTTQAARGEQTYRAQCAECHGRAMEGTTGHPLVGDDFL